MIEDIKQKLLILFILIIGNTFLNILIIYLKTGLIK